MSAAGIPGPREKRKLSPSLLFFVSAIRAQGLWIRDSQTWFCNTPGELQSSLGLCETLEINEINVN